MFTAHIEVRIEAGHRNGPPGHKCAGLLGPDDVHGHSWLVEIDWLVEDDQLNEWGWGPVDFGKAKDMIRFYDHHNLNLTMVKAPSSENFAKLLYGQFITTFGIAPLFVKIHEGHGNTMTYHEPADD